MPDTTTVPPSQLLAEALAEAQKKKRPVVAARPAQGWLWPTRSTRITTQPEAGHVGFDIGASAVGRVGDPVYAPVGSVVTAIKNDPNGYGLNLRLLTPQGLEIILGHLSAIVPGLSPGTRVTRGEEVALMGNSGNSSGPHLHYEVREPGPDRFAGRRSTTTAVDPRQFYPSNVGLVLPSAAPGTLSQLSAYRLASGVAPTSMAGFSDGKAPAAVGVKGPRVQPGQSVADAFLTGQKPSASKTAEGIVVGNIPFLGNITLAKPGAIAKNWLAFGFGAVIVLVSVSYLLRRVPWTPGWIVGTNVQSGKKVAVSAGRAASSAAKGLVAS